MLKPHGFLGVTIYCNHSDQMREHFPDLNEYRVVPLGDSEVLINRRRDGTLEVTDQLTFHGGFGETLEMREFGATALRAGLLNAGFREVDLLTRNVPRYGIFFDDDTSQPLIARKSGYSMDQSARSQLVDAWRAERSRADLLAEQIHLATDSRWLRLGRKIGVGPKFK